MDAKEKAKALVRRFRGFEMPNEHISSKQCALICVDEILKEAYCSYKTQYWQEVKQEIEKL
jgi:hypothetical protein